MAPNPRRWKTNFRCALNALPDIEEVTEKSCTRGNNAFKVYRMKPMPRAVGFRGEYGSLKQSIVDRSKLSLLNIRMIIFIFIVKTSFAN
jgi:hypothetical protein